MAKTTRAAQQAIIAGVVAALLSAPSFPRDSDPSAAKPNIIVILADDLGHADNSVYPGGRFPTPNLERLARKGVVFMDGYATAPVCAPSRAGLMTGRYPERFGFEYNDGGAKRALREGLGLPVEQITIAQLLKEDGYYTGLIGKWHLGQLSKFYPLNRGFDYFVGFLPGESSYIDPTLPGMQLAFGPLSNATLHQMLGQNAQTDARILKRALAGYRMVSRIKNLGRIGERLAGSFYRHPMEDIVEGPDHLVVHNEHEYLTDYLTQQAVRFIQKRSRFGKPYFLYLAYNAPHAPLMVTEKYYRLFPQIKNHQERVYAAMIAALDDGVGRVLDAVDKSGEARNTIIFFASDNGCAAYIPGLCTCWPLRGGKLTYYEGGIRVPFIMSWPGHIRAGMTYRQPVSLMDVLPTSVAAAGGKLPADRVYDGVNLVPYLTGKASGEPHPTLFWQAKPLDAVRHGPWKLWETQGPNTGVYGKYKLLFNLHDDQDESTNLAKQDPAKVKALEGLIHGWERSLIAPLWPTKHPAHYKVCKRPFTLPI